MGNCINLLRYEMLLYWSKLTYKDNISTFQDVVNHLLRLSSYIEYNKTVSYAQSHIQQGTMLLADILNLTLKSPSSHNPMPN